MNTFHSKVFLIVILFSLFFSGVVSANKLGLEINANSDEVEGKVKTSFPLNSAWADFGVGVLYNEEKYTLYSLVFGLNDQVFSSALTLGLGFKGIYGIASKDRKDYDIGAANFTFLAEYDFREVYENLPICLNISLVTAPRTLCFRDAEGYLEVYGGISLYIVQNAAVLVGARMVEVKIEEEPSNINISHDSTFLGFRLEF